MFTKFPRNPNSGADVATTEEHLCPNTHALFVEQKAHHPFMQGHTDSIGEIAAYCYRDSITNSVFRHFLFFALLDFLQPLLLLFNKPTEHLVEEFKLRNPLSLHISLMAGFDEATNRGGCRKKTSLFVAALFVLNQARLGKVTTMFFDAPLFGASG